MGATGRDGNVPTIVRAVAAITCTGLVWLAMAGVAGAHPLGLPAIVGVSAPTETTVELRWQAAPDDVGALFRIVGAPVPEGAAPPASVQERFGSSAAMQEHLAATLRPTDDRCVLDTVTATAVTQDGLTTRWTCPSGVATAEDGIVVEVAVLTALDERYRSLVYGSGLRDEPQLTTAATPAVTVLLAPGAPDPTSLRSSSQQGFVVGVSTTGTPGVLDRLETAVVTALDDDLPLTALLTALAVALVAGAAHGLAPGHGKAVAGAYLLADRGRPRHAVGLGVLVSAMHTGSTLLLGLLLLAVPRGPGTARLEAWLGLATGLVVLLVGVVLRHRRRRRADALTSAVLPGTQPHDHAHLHGTGPGQHVHVVDDVDPFTWRGVLALGAAGGLLPSPAALLVVITGVATDRLGAALALVLAFSVGLAGTVTMAGLAALWGRDRLHGVAASSPLVARGVALVPLAGAVVVLCLGCFLTARAATTLLT